VKVLASCAIGLAGLAVAWTVLTSEDLPSAYRPAAAPQPPTAEELVARQAVDDYRQAMNSADQVTLCQLAAQAAEAHRKAGATEGAAFWAQVSADRCAMAS
jgi:hypothetical protein